MVSLKKNSRYSLEKYKKEGADEFFDRKNLAT